MSNTESKKLRSISPIVLGQNIGDSVTRNLVLTLQKYSQVHFLCPCKGSLLSILKRWKFGRGTVILLSEMFAMEVKSEAVTSRGLSTFRIFVFLKLMKREKSVDGIFWKGKGEPSSQARRNMIPRPSWNVEADCQPVRYDRVEHGYLT